MGNGTAYGGSQYEEWNRREEQAEVEVGEDAGSGTERLGENASWVVVNGIIAHHPAKRDEISCHEAAKVEDLCGSGRRCRLRLQMEIAAAAADGDDESNQVGDPRPSFP